MESLDSDINASRGKIGTKIVLILALVIAIGLGGAYILFSPDRGHSGARNLGDTFTTALVGLQTEDTFQMMSQSYQDNSTTLQWDTWVEFTFDDYQGAPPKLVDEILVNPGNVYVESEEPTILVYEFEFDNESYRLPLTLIRQNGEWRVNEIGGWRQ